jgi:predicted Fe-Mo cluster-binding NifX family protein
MESKRIAVSSEGPGMDDQVDPRFGRAAGFVVVDLATGQSNYLDNGGTQVLAQGAGIQAAEAVARAGVGVVLSGFEAAGIQVIQEVDGMTVARAVEAYRRGELAPAVAPNAPAHGPGTGGRA